MIKKILPCILAMLLAALTLMGCSKEALQGDANHPSPKEQSKKADEGG